MYVYVAKGDGNYIIPISLMWLETGLGADFRVSGTWRLAYGRLGWDSP